MNLNHEQEGKRHSQFDSCPCERKVKQAQLTNFGREYVQVRKHEACRKKRSWIRTKNKKRKEKLSSRSIASEVPRACPNKAQAMGSPSETQQLDCNSKRRRREGQTRGNYHSRSIAPKVSENLCQTSTS